MSNATPWSHARALSWLVILCLFGTVAMARAASPSDINAHEAWDLNTGRRQVVVAVIDTGIDYMHPDLASVRCGERQREPATCDRPQPWPRPPSNGRRGNWFRP
jgi:hypothetical protein